MALAHAAVGHGGPEGPGPRPLAGAAPLRGHGDLQPEGGLRLGYSTPKRNVGLVIEQLDAILAAPVAESPFFNPATRDGDPAFRKTWEELVRDAIYPAVRRYRDYLKSEYLPAAREPQTVAANPDGARCYTASLRAYTGLDRSPREVFDSGQRYIEQREAKMKELGRKLFGTDDPAEIRKHLRDDRENRFKSRDELLAFSKAAVQRARQALPAWFARLPKADVVIEPQPEYQEKTNYSRYLPASEDGSRPGPYQINLYKPEEQMRASAERMAFHEVWPGHHLQISLAQERPQAHPITRYLSNAGFAEGWARYADTILADEMGLSSSDFNRLSMYAGVPHAMVEDPPSMPWAGRGSRSSTTSSPSRTAPPRSGRPRTWTAWPSRPAR